MSATSSPSDSGVSGRGVGPVHGVQQPLRLVAEIERGPHVADRRSVGKLRATATRRPPVRAAPRRAGPNVHPASLDLAPIASARLTCYFSLMSLTLPASTLNDQVYETLKRRLVQRQIGPGEKVSLHELAGELGVSRSPVHHALTRLVSEGLLTVKSRRGYYVTPLTESTVADGYDVRLALELAAAEAPSAASGAAASKSCASSTRRPPPRSRTPTGTRRTPPSTSTRSTSPATRSSRASTASSR